MNKEKMKDELRACLEEQVEKRAKQTGEANPFDRVGPRRKVLTI